MLKAKLAFIRTYKMTAPHFLMVLLKSDSNVPRPLILLHASTKFSTSAQNAAGSCNLVPRSALRL